LELKFRQLRADEIDCRVAQIKPNGLSLLLYKDARCDMNILDETVGPMNWQRKHGRDNANCIVSIWDEDKKQWIEKEDTGTESNTEAEKGLASDSFKRACFNWGLGRELYTAPFIWVSSDKCEITQKNGKTTCTDKFAVTDIKYTDGKISDLTIMNTSKNAVAYTMKRGSKKAETPKAEKPKPESKPEPPKEADEKQKLQDRLDAKVKSLIQNQGGVEFAICENCGGYIYKVAGKEGTIEVPKFCEMGLKRFGKAVCKNCFAELNAQKQAK
jgi:hypothetical protein